MIGSGLDPKVASRLYTYLGIAYLPLSGPVPARTCVGWEMNNTGSFLSRSSFIHSHSQHPFTYLILLCS